jgi:two-component system sensor histidine kinase/response regulator
LIIFKPFLRRVAHYFKRNEHSLKRETPLDKVTTDQYQQHLEMIMDNVHDAIVTFSAEGDILSINKAAKEMLLIDEKSQSISCYFKGFDLQNTILDYMEKVKLDQAPKELGAGFRSWARRSDNSLFPVDISLSHSNEKTLILIAVIRDVSDRKKIEDALLAEQALKSGVIEHSLNGIIVIDENGLVNDFNQSACSTFGYQKDEVIGRDMAELIIPEDQRHHHNSGIKHYLETGKSNILNQRVEVLAMRKNKELFPIELTVFPIHSMGRTVFAAAIQDITERKQAEVDNLESKDNAEKSNQFKSQFLASMSHEIRTPMNAVLGLLGLMQDTDMDEQQKRYISTALESGQGLLTLINDILDFSKIEAGKLTLEKHDFNVSQTLYGLIELMQVRAQNKNISLVSYIDPQISDYLNGDQGRIRQILLNLISNAIKFTDEGSVVVRLDALELHNGRYELCLSVEDTGIGIKPEDQSQLFDDFVQADGADSRRYGGTGLGLSITKKLVEMMSGRIGVDSEEKKGSRFSVYLQLEQGKSKPVSFFPMRLQGIRIAMLSASRPDALVLKDQLQSMGAKISTVSNVESVFALFDDTSVDIMLADYRDLPYEADRLIDEFSFYFPNIPCFLLMEKDSQKISDHFKNMGFRDCISLYIRRNILADVLERSIGREIVHESGEFENVENYKIDGSIPFRILLAEDSQANQLVAINVLENAGYKVDAVANGIEAIKAVQSLPYDLILMDLQMPEMGGVEATEHIRKLPSSIGSVPIFAMTANVLGDVKIKCKSVGMNGFIAKPINKHEVFARLSLLYQAKKESLLAQQLPIGGDEYATDKNMDFENIDIPIDHKNTSADEDYISQKVLFQLIEDTSLAAVKRMMTVFDSETINRVESMLKLIDAENWLELGKEAHTLKSSAASYGAIRLSKLAEIIERDVLESDSNAIAIDAANYSELSTLSIESIAQLKTILEQQNA